MFYTACSKLNTNSLIFILPQHFPPQTSLYLNKYISSLALLPAAAGTNSSSINMFFISDTSAQVNMLQRILQVKQTDFYSTDIQKFDSVSVSGEVQFYPFTVLRGQGGEVWLEQK